MESQKKNCITAQRREQLAELGVQCEGPEDGDCTIAKNVPKKPVQKRAVPDNKYDRLWEEKFEELKEYKRLRGTAHISSKSKEHSGLAAWILKQRALKRAGNLAPDRQAKLDSLGFAWTFDKNGHGAQKNWFTEYDKLAEYHKETGHCSPPAEGDTKELAQWVTEQKEQAPYLSDKQRKMLEKIDFQWPNMENGHHDDNKTVPAKKASTRKQTPVIIRKAESDRNDGHWEDMFKVLQVYARHTGSAAVPSRLKGNMKLANWCKRQRTNFAKGVLSMERKDKLDSVGFAWTLEEGSESTPGDKYTRDMQNDAKWNEMFGYLKQYQAIHGTSFCMWFVVSRLRSCAFSSSLFAAFSQVLQMSPRRVTSLVLPSGQVNSVFTVDRELYSQLGWPLWILSDLLGMREERREIIGVQCTGNWHSGIRSTGTHSVRKK